MVTKNTLEDIRFGEQYIEFVSRRGKTPEARARAKILIATIQMLDLRHPEWRGDLLKELDKQGVSREIEKIFPLPDVDEDKLFNEFMQTVIKGN
jgi:cell division FtsZ-interacting protein ZapD